MAEWSRWRGKQPGHFRPDGWKEPTSRRAAGFALRAICAPSPRAGVLAIIGQDARTVHRATSPLSGSMRVIQNRYLLVAVGYCVLANVLPPYVSAEVTHADDRSPMLPEMVVVRDQTDHSTGFAMSKREVTWKQYLQSVDQARCPMPQTSFGKNRDVLSATDSQIRDDYPVTGVSADHVKCYIAWLNHSTRSAYRLPTLSEWQVAARKAQPRLWSSFERAGAAALVRSDPRASVREATVQIVGSGPPSSDGIFDLEGNAGEFVSDLHYFSGLEAEWCGGLGLNTPLVIGRGGYDIERGSGREIPGNFRSVGHLACGIPMNSVGFRLASSLVLPSAYPRP